MTQSAELADGLILALKAGLAITLITSGSSKAMAVDSFASTLSTLGVRSSWSRPAALLLVATESALGLGSFVGIHPPTTDGAVLVLSGVFLVASVFGALTRRGAACKCFGALSGGAFGLRSIFRSGILCLAAATVVSSERRVSALVSARSAWSLAIGVLGVVVWLTTAQAASAITSIRGGESA